MTKPKFLHPDDEEAHSLIKAISMTEWMNTGESKQSLFKLTKEEWMAYVLDNELPSDFLYRHRARYIDDVLKLLESLVEESECSLDHSGDCQAHVFLNLDGRQCPNAEALELLRKLEK